MESQGEDPAQLTYAQLMQRAAEGGNWQRALELFDGGWWRGMVVGGCCDGCYGGERLSGARRAPSCANCCAQPASLIPSMFNPPACSIATHAPAGMESSLALTGSQPNNLTYSAAIIACARLADWQRALELKDQMLARWVGAGGHEIYDMSR